MKITSISPKLAVVLRFIALPLFVLLPFFLAKDTGAICFGPRAAANGTAVSGMTVTGYPRAFGVILFAAMICFFLFSFIQIGVRKYRQRYDQVKQQLIVALSSVVATAIAYMALYNNSQLKYPPTWYCDSNNVLHGGIPAQAHFGMGLTPWLVVAIIVLYLVGPLTALLVTRPSSQKLWLAK